MIRKDVNSNPLIGFAVGDALAWGCKYGRKLENVAELPVWERVEGFGSYSRVEDIDSGEFSDYTLQALCVARSLLYSNWFEYLYRNELPTWLAYSRGTLSTGKFSIANLVKNLPWATDSNQTRNYYTLTDRGSIPRAIPHVIYNGKDLYTTLKSTFESAILTSGNPMTPLSACLYASALYYFMDVSESDLSTMLSDILESYLSKFMEVQNFSSKIISSYIQRSSDYINFAEQWHETISEINCLMVEFDDTKDIRTYFLEGINSKNIIIREVLYSICLSCSVKSFEEAVDVISRSTYIDKHFVTSMVFSLLSARFPESKYPLYFYSVQSRLYMSNLCKHYHNEERIAPILKTFKFYEDIVEEITSLQQGDTYNLDPIGQITILLTGDISKSAKNVCKASVCSLGGETDKLSGLFLNFYSFK